MMLKKTLAAIAAASLCAAAGAQTAAADNAAAPTTPPAATASPVTGNLTLVSDYRFRGISQSWLQPAVQGGLDYTHASGFYLGNWNSSVSANSYNNGASLEMDFYGGWRFDLAKDTLLDVGVLHYYYPGAKLNSAPATPSRQGYDNTEVYAGVTLGGFNAKLSYALTDYFGLNSQSAGYAYWSALPARGDSKGTTYLDLNYSADLGNALTLGLHAGHTTVRNYGELSYSDYKLSLAKEVGGYVLTGAIVGTNAYNAYYQAGNYAGLEAKKLGNATLLLSVGKTF